MHMNSSNQWKKSTACFVYSLPQISQTLLLALNLPDAGSLENYGYYSAQESN